MEMIGIDLHKRESQLCILDAEGHATERRIVTSRERFTAVLGARPGFSGGVRHLRSRVQFPARFASAVDWCDVPRMTDADLRGSRP